ncbi:MAG TPA: acetone carboxylase subunit gamma [Candidatus Binataceae bacterium]|nr:acetone carboxylase subunit gamma [Candidatus Binataceae bacterium]
MDSYPPKEVLRDLIEGKLDWVRIKQIMSSPKDPDRFSKYLALAQERVRWKEKILLPYGEHLYIVVKQGGRIVKCGCGHEFGDWRENWKFKALIHARNTRRKLREIYPGPRSPDPDWCEIREFYCPGCGVQLEVENVPPGYPINFDFLPDLDAFYAQWLGKPLPDQVPAEDRSAMVTRQWAEELDRNAGARGASNGRTNRHGTARRA